MHQGFGGRFCKKFSSSHFLSFNLNTVQVYAAEPAEEDRELGPSQAAGHSQPLQQHDPQIRKPTQVQFY